MKRGVLLDTSFFLRLYNIEDPLHENAKGYYKYFLESEFTLKISTIAIAEFCVKGSLSDLPMKNLQVVPFNLDHAVRAGELINFVRLEKESRGVIITQRLIIPNDTKMFAQADLEHDIESFISSDNEAVKIHSLLSGNMDIRFSYIDISVPHTNVYGELF